MLESSIRAAAVVGRPADGFFLARRRAALILIVSLVVPGAFLGSTPAAAQRAPSAARKQLASDRSAQPQAADAEFEREAEEALRAGVPEVALTKIESLSPRARSSPKARLIEIEAWARSGEPARALEISTEGMEKVAAASFWQGRALASLSRWPEALLRFQRAADLGFGPEASLGVADSLIAIGATEAAVEVLDPLIGTLDPSSQKAFLAEALIRRAEMDLAEGDQAAAGARIEQLAALDGIPPSAIDLLRGRLLILQGEAAAAADRFRAALTGDRGPQTRLAAAATLGLAKALESLGNREEAKKIVGSFISANPYHPFLPDLFAAHERLRAEEPLPLDPELAAWSRGPNTPRKIYAVYYVARAEARGDKLGRAISRLKDFLADFPDSPVAVGALLELARVHLEEGDHAAALAAVTAAQDRRASSSALSWIAFLEGRALLGLERFSEAATAFERAATDRAIEEIASFNAAICAIRTGDYKQFLARYANFSSRFPESQARRDLLLEHGLFQARNRDPEAARTLELFLRDFPGHPREGEVRLALAEIRFQQGPEEAAAALDLLAAARESALPGPLSEQADLLELWIADSLQGVSSDEVIRLGRALLDKKPASPMTPLIRMKLGSVYFRIEDFANARDQFHRAAKEATEPALIDRALFMAGLAAMRMMDPDALDAAIGIFEEVAQGGGSLALEARRFQAEIQSMLGRHAEAAALYDSILSENPPPRERAEITLLKANALKELGSAGDTAQILKALPLYDAAAESADSFPALRNEALFMKGRALEALGQIDKALATYFDVLRTPMGGALDPEFFWFYKAGFDAARLLEERGSFESAVEVYSQLSNADGPGAKDAARRMEQLRLRHFLWGE